MIVVDTPAVVELLTNGRLADSILAERYSHAPLSLVLETWVVFRWALPLAQCHGVKIDGCTIQSFQVRLEMVDGFLLSLTSSCI